MTTFQKAQLTLYGLHRIARAHEGERMLFTSIGLGDQALTGNLHEVTELTGEKQRFPISGSKVSGNNFWASCKPVDIEDPEGIYVKAMGLYIADPSHEDDRHYDRLYAVASIIPDFTEGPGYIAFIPQNLVNAEINYDIRMNTIISPSALIEIVGGIGSLGIATVPDLGLVRSTNKRFGVSVNKRTGEMGVNDLEELADDIAYIMEGHTGGNKAAGGTPGFGSEPFLAASGRRKLLLKGGTRLLDAYFERDTELDAASLLDTGSIVNGRDYYLFLYKTSGGDTSIIISLEKNAPLGLDPDKVFPFGGFHTLCASAGTGMTYVEGGRTLQHPLNGFVAGDILPASPWCLNHRPFCESEGMVYIASLDFWCDIYLASGSGVHTRSVFRGAITRSRQYVDFVEDMFCVRKELLDDGEFSAAMLGSNEQTSVASEAAATNGGAGGRSDTRGRRMISIYGVEEGCGSLHQFLRSTSGGGTVGRMSVSVSQWIDLTVSSGAPVQQSGNKGTFTGTAVALTAGGYGNAGSGSRSRNAGQARSFAGTNRAARGRSRAMR